MRNDGNLKLTEFGWNLKSGENEAMVVKNSIDNLRILASNELKLN